MPLFMALAGYVAKMKISGSIIAALTKKAKTLVLPWLFVGTLYVLFQFGVDDLSKFFSLEARQGYWFLMTLFVIHLIIIGANVVLRRFTSVTDNKVIAVYLIVMAISFYLIPRYVDKLPLCMLHHMMVYFLSGWFLRNNKICVNLLKKEGAMAAMFFTWLFLMAFSLSFGVTYYIKGLTATIFLISIGIRLNEQCGGSNKIPAKVLSYWGKKSLAIYVLHYFFLINMPSLDYIPFTTSNITVSSMASFVLAVVVICFVLLIEKILSQNKYLKLLCFGQ